MNKPTKHEIAVTVVMFHRKAGFHEPSCEWYHHFLHHIDETTGMKFDCEHGDCDCAVPIRHCGCPESFHCRCI